MSFWSVIGIREGTIGMAAVTVRNLRKTFSGGAQTTVAIDDLSFDVADHSFVSIVGPSGCGKSTLLNILSGIETPTSGVAEIEETGAAGNLGYVFQSARLLPWRTVLDNMLFVAGARRRPESVERALRYLDMVGLASVRDSYPAQLSGGMQQRVGIARAFSIEPSALLMDEPFSHLDALSAARLQRELQLVWQSTRKTIIFVTHDVVEAVELSERIIILEKEARIQDDIQVDLPFPRDVSDSSGAVMKAEILKKLGAGAPLE